MENRMPTNLREKHTVRTDMGPSKRPADAASLIKAARELAPKIEAARADIEHDRQIPRALVDTLGDAGLFALWLPKALDGPELNLVDYIRVIEELARSDGSVAWCATVAACYSRIAGYLQPEIARRIFDGGRTVVAGTINPTGKAFAVDGGYRVTGRWAYGSGILHSTWTLGNCIVHDREGPRRASSGGLEIRLVIFPTSAVEVIDTWHVSGLRGTGSHDYRVADLFVRDDHSISCFDATPLQAGTLYAVPMITVLSVAIAAVPLGIARAAIDAAVELAQVKTPYSSSLLLRDKPTFQAAVGRAEALLGSARSFLLATVGDLWDEVSSGVAASMKRRAMVRLGCTQAAQSAAEAVDLMYAAGGSTSLYETSRLERCFRDVHACTQHIATSTDSYEQGGRVLLGLDPGRAQF
jgi:indole-3-acetate monooxygenase